MRSPAQLHALAACLRTLGVDPARMWATAGAAEAAVYLAQEMGAPFLYVFTWRDGRPRCEELAGDLERVAGDRGRTPYRVAAQLRMPLRQLRRQLEAPPRSLAPARWLVLLATWHYLRVVDARSVLVARSSLAGERARLARHVGAAETALQSLGLVVALPAPGAAEPV